MTLWEKIKKKTQEEKDKAQAQQKKEAEIYSKFVQKSKDQRIAKKAKIKKETENKWQEFVSIKKEQSEKAKQQGKKEKMDFAYVDFNLTDSAFKEKELSERKTAADNFITSNSKTYSNSDKDYQAQVVKGFETLNNKKLDVSAYQQDEYFKQVNRNEYDRNIYAWNSASTDLKNNYAYLVGKYGENSNQAKDALDQIQYKYGQEYEQKKADEISAKQAKKDEQYNLSSDAEDKNLDETLYYAQRNLSLIAQGLGQGAKDTINGIRTSFDVMAGHVTTPQVTKARKLAWEEALANSPQAVQTLGNIAETVGYMGTIIATSLLTGGYGGAVAANVTMGTSVFGNQYSQNIAEGKDVMESIEHAALTAGAEVLLTRVAALTIGTVRGLSASEPLIKQTISKLSVNPKVQTMLDTVGRMMGEGVEEYTQEILTPILRNISFGEDNEFKAITPQALYAFLLGAITAGFIDVVSSTSTKIRNGEEVPQADIVQQQAAEKLGLSNASDYDAIAESVMNELSSEEKIAYIKGYDLTNADNLKLQNIREALDAKTKPVEPLKQSQSAEQNVQTDINAKKKKDFVKNLNPQTTVQETQTVEDAQEIDQTMQESQQQTIQEQPQPIDNVAQKQTKTVQESQTQGKEPPQTLTEPFKQPTIEEKSKVDIKPIPTKKYAASITQKYDKDINTADLNAEEVHKDMQELNSRLIEMNEKNRQKNQAIDAETTSKAKEAFLSNTVAREKRQRKLYTSIQNSKILSTEMKAELEKNQKIKLYTPTSNVGQYRQAYNELYSVEDTNTAINEWLDIPTNRADDIDIMKGIIIMKMYDGLKQYELANLIGEHVAEMGTSSGRAVQVLSMIQKSSPDRKVAWAKSTLNKLKQEYVKNQSLFSKELASQKNLDKFTLTKEETEQIYKWAKEQEETNDTVVHDEMEKNIQKLIYGKAPSSWRNKFKSWNRISMLLNPKTWVRNIAGNAIYTPIQMSADTVSQGIEHIFLNKMIDNYKKNNPEAYKKNYLDKGKTLDMYYTSGASTKGMLKGSVKGVKGWASDIKNKTDTRSVLTDKFDSGNQYKNNFNSKFMNKVDRFVFKALEAGDRPFFEAWEMKSINNQLKQNNLTEPTPQTMEIAFNEALEATYQGENGLTKTLSSMVKALNFGKEFGLGTIMQPFVKTPANLIRLSVQLSPAGSIIAAKKYSQFTKALQEGNYNPKLQREAVDAISKAILGMIIPFGVFVLNQAGAIVGAPDKDKDVANYEKYVMGIQPYSFKVGDKYFSFSWAQPVGTTISMVNAFIDGVSGATKSENTEQITRTGQAFVDAFDATMNSLSDSSNILLEQSMFRTLETLMSSDDKWIALADIALQLPNQATPTLLGQIAQSLDDTMRQTYEKGGHISNVLRQIQAKIPVLSKSLEPNIDVLGKEIKRYGGKENPFYYMDIFFNPALGNENTSTAASREIYRLYQETGDKTVMPRTADYTIPYTKNGVKKTYTLTTKDKAEYQKILGKGTNDAVKDILRTSAYKALSQDEKIGVVTDIMKYYSAKAKEKLVKGYGNAYEYPSAVKSAVYADKAGVSVGKYMLYKYDISKLNAKNSKGESVSGLKKRRIANYLNSTNLSYKQKLLMFGLTGNGLTSNEKSIMKTYIKSLNLSAKEQKDIFNKLKIK